MPYLRNAWYVAAWARDVVLERPLGLRVLNEPIVIWRSAAGDIVAFEDRCIHRLAPLSLGRCEGERLRCMYHGVLYDRTGRVVEIPGQDMMSVGLRVRAYPVVERHGWVWVWMGCATADEGLIPPLMDMGQPGCVFGRGQLDYDAEARLVNDNLLDLSHTSFLHAATFQVSESWARQQPKVTQHGRSIRSERWLRNERTGGLEDRDCVDIHFRQDFFAPGALLMIDRRYSAGTADALNGRWPEASRVAQTFTFSSQAITPLTERITRYFYLFGTTRRADETEFDMTLVKKAFAEDKVMIEAQQRNIDLAPNRRFIATAADRAVVLFNRLLEKLACEELAGSGPTSSPGSM